jgi:drug/metabolite transporter (DMT)-like permease
MGFIGIFFYFLFLFAALNHATVQDTIIINYTWPIWMVLFSIPFIGEKVSFKNFLSVLIGFTGLVIIVTRGVIFDLVLILSPGFVFAFLSALFYGLFSAIGKKNGRDPVISMLFYFIFSFLYSIVGFISFSNMNMFIFWDLAAVIWLGIFSCGLGFLFWFKALHQKESYKLANFVYLTPFISFIFSYFFIGEQIQISSILGFLLIIVAIFINKIDPSNLMEFSGNKNHLNK